MLEIIILFPSKWIFTYVFLISLLNYFKVTSKYFQYYNVWLVKMQYKKIYYSVTVIRFCLYILCTKKICFICLNCLISLLAVVNGWAHLNELCAFSIYLTQDIDSKVQLTVFTDRCQGGTSLKSGSMEFMVINPKTTILL